MQDFISFKIRPNYKEEDWICGEVADAKDQC